MKYRKYNSLCYEAHNLVGGRKIWRPGKALAVYLQHLGFEPPHQRQLFERVLEAVSETFPELLHHIHHTPGFSPVGTRMVSEWTKGLARLSDRTSIVVPDLLAIARTQGERRQVL